MTTRDDTLALDARDPLAPLRARFTLPEGVNYLDGNSLGVLPAAAPARVAQAVQTEWGEGLIRSWNTANWVTLPQRVGDKIGRLIGAQPGETLAEPFGDRGEHELGIAQWCERDEDRAAVRLVCEEARELEREARLPGSAWPEDRQHSGSALVHE